MLSEKLDLSVIIPCFKSPSTLPNLVQEIEEVATSLQISFEVILVCDSCPSNTWQLIKSIPNSKHVSAFLLGRNIGQHRATAFGFSQASGALIATIDDDYQHPPRELSTLLSEYRKGFDLVYGIPVDDEHGIFRNIASRCVKSTLTTLKVLPNANKISSFRLFNSKVLANKVDFTSVVFNIDSLLLQNTNRVSMSVVRMNKRREGHSNYSLISLIKHSLNLIFGKIESLMSFILLFGSIATLLSFTLLLFFVWSTAEGHVTVPGFATIIIFLTFAFSINFIILAVIGRIMSIIFLQLRDQELEIGIKDFKGAERKIS